MPPAISPRPGVRLVQQALIDLGFPMPISVKCFGSPDGIYGNETTAKVSDFQRKNGLSADGRAGHDTLAKLDLKRICIAGHSAGGHLALCLAAFEPSVRRVLSLAGVLDLRRAWELHLSNDAVVEFLGGTPAEVPEHYREASPAERSIPHAVQRLVHGTADDSVPYEISKNYADRKKKSGENAELITLPETGHFEIVDPGSIVWPKIEQLFLALTNP